MFYNKSRPCNAGEGNSNTGNNFAWFFSVNGFSAAILIKALAMDIGFWWIFQPAYLSSKRILVLVTFQLYAAAVTEPWFFKGIVILLF
ncbi:MAG: hypothetical protein V4685_04180 [Bacteroidota bacterium]